MKVFFSILPLLLAHVASATIQDRITPSHSQDIWNRAAGFPGGYVYSMAQTGDGYLWIGTSRGLVRYDGLTFELIPESDSSADTRFAVADLVTDASNQMWATDDRTQLFRYSAGSLLGPLAGGKGINRTGPVNRSRGGWLLFASETQGLVEYEHGVARVLLDASLIPVSPTTVAQAADGTYWIGTRDEGVFNFEVTEGAPKIRHVEGLTDTKINCLLPIGASTLLIGTDKGLLSVHNGKVIQEMPLEVKGIEIHALASGTMGTVWIGANGRLFKCNVSDIGADGRIHSLTHSDLRFPVTALFEDRASNLWIGGPEIIERYRANGFSTYSSSEGLPCTNCGSIYVDDQESVWFAPSDGGLFRLAHGSIKPVTVAGLADDTVYSIWGGAGELWVARKYGGVTRLRLERGAIQPSTYTERAGLAENNVTAIYREPDGTVWAGTAERGASRFRNGGWQTFTTRNGLPSNRISVITGNSNGQIFLGTSDGIAELKNNRWIAYLTRDGLPPGAIESLFLDGAGILWIGTTRGLAFLEGGKVHVPISAPDALLDDVVGIAEADDWFWITTVDRVLRVKRSALLNDLLTAGDYREFGLSEGLPSTEGVKGDRSLVKDTRGQIWLSLNQGISVLQPSEFPNRALPVTIRPDGIIADGKQISQSSNIRVPSGRRRLTFRYAGVNISNPESVKYQYRLDNVDATWSDPTVAREVDYTNIPPGRYRFEVITRDPDGLQSGRQTIAFEVEPAYWQTRWFQAATTATIILLAWGLYRVRLRQMTARINLRYAERIAERTRIARELHDTLLQSFQGLLLRFQSVSNLLPTRPEEAKQRLDGAIDQAAQAIAESRDTVHELRSSTLLNSDLGAAITALAQEFTANQDGKHGSDIRVQVEGTPRDLNPLLRDEVYRIAAEALRNACRHAEAQNIEVEIHYEEGRLQLRVRDDGKGIDPDVLHGSRPAGHWGLRGMRERAELLKGKLEVWSKPDSGTEIELTVPAAVAYGPSPVPASSRE